MMTLITSLVKIAWLMVIIPLSLTYNILCIVIWLVWGILFGVSVGPRPINIGPFRAE